LELANQDGGTKERDTYQGRSMALVFIALDKTMLWIYFKQNVANTSLSLSKQWLESRDDSYWRVVEH